jgi:hypothetical protein
MPGGSSSGGGIEARGDFRNSPAAPGIAPECVARDFKKRVRKRVGDQRVGLASGLQSQWMLRERLDQGHSERPHVGSGGKRRNRGFGSVMSVESAR